MTVTILDGGMGQELIARSPDAATPLWATRVMLDHPQIVRAVHDDYFAAGAEIATTNTYAILPDRLDKYDLGDQLVTLHEQACRTAAEARDAHGSGRVAGSLGPMGWSYRADMAPPADEAAPVYERLARIQAPLVDLFIIETMAGIDQARGALMGALAADKPVWLGLSVDDEDGTRMRSGEALADILPVLSDLPPAAVLINCSIPEAVNDALPIIAQAGLPFGAYANGFTKITSNFAAGDTTVDNLSAREDLSPDRYADFAQGWRDLGATIIGGCCEVGPAHIRTLSQRFKGA